MNHDALLQAAEAIRTGKIVALKGIGGFQLLVDARNDDAVRRLRARKHREEKPFALMFPSLQDLKNECDVSEMEERLLLSPEAPIVLLTRRRTSTKSELSGIADSVAPRNPYLGAMLPYSPLHHILMSVLSFPIVATSGNISDEPICTDEHQALVKLRDIADLFVVHDRPIERHVDDSVIRVMAGRAQMIRRARGYAPFPVDIATQVSRSVLAVGGHLKNSVAMNIGSNVFVSQHIGDLSTEEAFSGFRKVTADFQKLYDASPDIIVHDLHPDYLSTRFAKSFDKENLGVQHHFAHIASCMAENQLSGRLLGISWDGTGYGEDGTVWGGEFLLTDGIDYKRAATFRSFKLPGGSASVKEPRRTTLGLLYEIYGEGLFGLTDLEPVCAFSQHQISVLKVMLKSGLNSPVTTSVGRLFDAVSSILGIRQVVNFEGQGAMELEFAIGDILTDETYSYDIREMKSQEYFQADYVIDWNTTMRNIISEKCSGKPAGLISTKFHNTLAQIILDVAKRVGEAKVALSGGCFQNKYLTERAIGLLSENGFKPYWHQRIPPNDGGISLGQVFVALNQGKNSLIRSEKVESRNRQVETTGQKQEAPG